MKQVNPDALRKLDDVMARLQRVMHVRSLVKKFGLTSSQMFILRYLARCGQAKSSDIGKIVGLSPGAVTQVTDEMIRLRLVDRVRSEEDRRVVYVSLTDEGKDTVERIRLAGSKRLLAILEQLPPDDTDSFIRILEKVVDIIDQEGANLDAEPDEKESDCEHK
ncbi:MarR family winged helix-turn-helix transcriptional regulator [Alicyclobacillus sp. SO9]|uniref:MarR family winged helix-turn-helix transcriptional regulator n=1 Tax=Alicyclobacillus sp. SO9 TaxID=2665646 RepID=UPI0018E8D11E|nr:MarR family transcriptional regulator [Alicyclobacillus sp. SO9]QQE77055.1 MarR family transcriptional regulator [Alicyclobacillus sp. SO9]